MDLETSFFIICNFFLLFLPKHLLSMIDFD